MLWVAAVADPREPKVHGLSKLMTNSVKYVTPNGPLWHSDFTNSISAGAPPRTALGELTMLPRFPSWLGSGYPLPIPNPSTPSTSRSRRFRLPSRLGAFGIDKRTLKVPP